MGIVGLSSFLFALSVCASLGVNEDPVIIEPLIFGAFTSGLSTQLSSASAPSRPATPLTSMFVDAHMRPPSDTYPPVANAPVSPFQEDPWVDLNMRGQASRKILAWQKEWPRVDSAESSFTSRATIRVGQSLVVHLPVTPGPRRDFLWKLNSTYDDMSLLVNREELEDLGWPSSATLQFLINSSGYVAPKNDTQKTHAHQQFVFKALEPGYIKLAFLYNRPWVCDKQSGGSVSYILVRVIPRKSVKTMKHHTPETRTNLTLIKGQEIDIRLTNSDALPFNLWKLMETYDERTGFVDGKNILQYMIEDSGYVPPETSLFDETAKQTPDSEADTRDTDTDTETRKGDTETREGDTETNGVIEEGVAENSPGHQKFTFSAKNFGRQKLRFSFVKPWLPDTQFDRTDAVIYVNVVPQPTSSA